jgi:hypothetical protein
MKGINSAIKEYRKYFWLNTLEHGTHSVEGGGMEEVPFEKRLKEWTQEKKY